MNEASGNVQVVGEPDMVNEFIQKYNALPYGYETWENAGYEAISVFSLGHDFDPDFWKKASKEYPNLKFNIRYQLGLAYASKCVVVAGVATTTSFNWDDCTTYTWLE